VPGANFPGFAGFRLGSNGFNWVQIGFNLGSNGLILGSNGLNLGFKLGSNYQHFVLLSSTCWVQGAEKLIFSRSGVAQPGITALI
jgi:hypothetical protein